MANAPQNVLQEVTAPELGKDHIEKRVADWETRIDNLYSDIVSWLPSGWTVERTRSVRMEAELMKEYDVPPRDLPVLDLLHGGVRVASIEPRYLWIIGANGRLDLLKGDKHYVIFDEADNFAKPYWKISDIRNRQISEPFGRDRLLSLLSGDA